jgi:sugar lactone lactonase YvrE
VSPTRTQSRLGRFAPSRPAGLPPLTQGKYKGVLPSAFNECLRGVTAFFAPKGRDESSHRAFSLLKGQENSGHGAFSAPKGRGESSHGWSAAEPVVRSPKHPLPPREGRGEADEKTSLRPYRGGQQSRGASQPPVPLRSTGGYSHAAPKGRKDNCQALSAPKGQEESGYAHAAERRTTIPTHGVGFRPSRRAQVGILVAFGVSMLAVGCAQSAKPLLVAPEPPVVWPKPPDPPRVRYVGELKSSADLGAAKPASQVLREVFYGPEAPSPLVKPHAVAISADGNRLAVADTDIACVHVFDLASRAYRLITAWGAPHHRFESPTGVAWDGQTLWVTDSRLHAVAIIGPTGTGRLIGADCLLRPAGLAFCAATGRAYVADSVAHAIVAFDRQGQEVLRFGKQGSGPGEFNFPLQIACGPDGTLVVADALNFRIQRFSSDGTPLNAFGRKGDAPGDFALPKGVAVGPDGNIWVVDAQFENLQAFTPSGELLMFIGQEGQGPGEFWLPAGICIDSKRRMWIADTYNRRVQVFELLP